jgi:hypothetical protein
MPFFRFFSYSEKMGFGFTYELMVDGAKKRRYCANSIALV